MADITAYQELSEPVTGGINKQFALAVMLLLAAMLLFLHFRNEPYTVEQITFPTNLVPGTINDTPVDVISYLYLPVGATGLLPAVVISPSSGGVEEERELYYAKTLAKKGIAALILDSFKSRGLKDSVYDQSVLESWQMENDAYAALKRLADDPRIDADRIAIMGVSKGATVAMNTAHLVNREWAGIEDSEFAAHIAISPDCSWTTRSSLTTGAPIYFMLAELDDQVPVQSCVDKAERLRKSGNQAINIIVYPGVYHAWEELGSKPLYDKNAENYSDCRVWIEDDGTMVAADTGEVIREDGWYEWAERTCKKFGSRCCGGTRQQKEKATNDILAFLRRYEF